MFWLSLVLTAAFFAGILLSVVLLRKRNPRGSKRGLYTRLQFSGKLSRFKKVTAIVAICFILGAMLFGCFNLATRIAYTRLVNGTATWVHTNGQSYLKIEADDYYSLGYLEGKHLAPQILFTMIAAELRLVRDGVDYRVHAKDYLPYIPSDYITLMEGIADGASHATGMPVSFNDILVQNCFTDIMGGIIGPRLAIASSAGCTALGVVNDDNSTMFGENYDNDPLSKPGLAWVLYQLPGKAGLFSLRMGGMVIPITRNSHGVTSLATIISSKMEANAIVPASILARLGGEHARNASEAVDIVMQGNKFSASYNLIIADDVSVNAFEVLPSGAQEVSVNPVALANRFWSEGWNDEFFARGGYSRGRQQRAEYELEQAFDDGEVTHDELVSILMLDEPHPDWNNSEICRTTGGSQTLAFLTKEGFGLGTPRDGIGENPF